jgi:hypothetical protein
MKNYACLISLGLLLTACATVDPAADPLVVRVEQTQIAARQAFDMVLHLDDANRPFWRTNAPQFHLFCEWLRTPQPYSVGLVPRAVAIQLNVDDLKQAYKWSRTAGNSNALFSAWSVLNAAIIQTSAWSNIITTPVHP